MAKKKLNLTPPTIGTLDHILAEVPDGQGRYLSLIWARALAVTGDAKYRKFIEAYDERDRDDQPLEYFCEAAGLDPDDYLADFVKCSKKYAHLHVELIKYAGLPKVVQTSYAEAQKPEGWNDRNAILKQEGLHHAPQANQINVNQNVMNQTAIMSHSDFTSQLEAIESGVEPRAIEAASTEFIDAEIVHEDEKVLVERWVHFKRL